MDTLLTVTEALDAVLAKAQPLQTERVALELAAGRILAEAIVSTVDLPPFASSSMDGYAVRASDTPGTLRISGRVAAGRPESRALQSGEAMEISTGGVVPDGADTVIPVERIIVGDGVVDAPDVVAERDNIRSAGGDVRAGDVVMAAGVELTPARLAAAAACGVESVIASRVPRVAIVVTGSELRSPGESLEAGQIYESNGIMLEALLRAAGAHVERHGATEDSADVLERALSDALAADIVVTSGGVSVGPHDLVRRVEARLGVDEVFWGVAMRPGKPLAFGVRGQTLVFGLPGNPVSSLVGCLLFVRPALLALCGHPDPAPQFRPGTLATEVRPRAERDDFVRARIRWTTRGAELDPILGQESHMIVHTTAADAIVHIPRGTEALGPGAPVGFLQL